MNNRFDNIDLKAFSKKSICSDMLDDIGPRRLEQIEKDAANGIYPDDTPIYGLLAFTLYLTATGRGGLDGASDEASQNYAILLEQFTAITTPYLIIRARKAHLVEIRLLAEIVPAVNAADMYVMNVIENLIFDIRHDDPVAFDVARRVMKLFFKKQYKFASKYNVVNHKTLSDFLALEDATFNEMSTYDVINVAICSFIAKINRAKFEPTFYPFCTLIEGVWIDFNKSTYKEFCSVKCSPPDSFLLEYFPKYKEPDPMSTLAHELSHKFSSAIRHSYSIASYEDEPFDIETLLPSICYKSKAFKNLDKDDANKLLAFMDGTIDAFKTTIYRSSLVDTSVMLSLLTAMAKPTAELAMPVKVIKEEPAPVKTEENETIESIKAQLFEERSKTEAQRALLEETRKECDELKKNAVSIEDMSYELKALREYVYNQSEDAPAASSVSTDEMITEIKPKRVVIIGGHDNWTSKLKEIFPRWTFLKPSVTGTVPTNVIDNAEKVYFFSDHICHPQYNRFLDAARLKNIPVGYIARINIDSNIRQFYKDFAVNPL